MSFVFTLGCYIVICVERVLNGKHFCSLEPKLVLSTVPIDLCFVIFQIVEYSIVCCFALNSICYLSWGWHTLSLMIGFWSWDCKGLGLGFFWSLNWGVAVCYFVLLGCSGLISHNDSFAKMDELHIVQKGSKSNNRSCFKKKEWRNFCYCLYWIM